MQKSTTKIAGELQRNREKLFARIDGHSPGRFLAANAGILDDYFRDCFENSNIGPAMGIDKNPFALVALGGYGRQEQCVHSDVDLLILFEKSVPAHTDALVREMVYPLWDIGLDVGHATRSLKECRTIAAEDYEVFTSLLDARFICGVSRLYTTMMEKTYKSVIGRRSGQVISWLVKRNYARHNRFGDSSYLLEPNLKDGQGGLRDYHTMLWIARIRGSLKAPRDLEYSGLLSHDEYEQLSRAAAFVWDVRNRLHLIAGRKCDQLYFEHQVQMAERMGIRERRGHQPVEIFLGKLHGHMEYVKQQLKGFLYEQGYDRELKRRRPKPSRPTPLAGSRALLVSRGMLSFSSPEAILNDPSLLMTIFRESARLKLPLSSESRRLVANLAHLVDDRFRRDRGILQAFEKILVTPAQRFNVLNEMLNSGFLGRYLPAFAGIENRIQYDEYHLFPVDRHLIKTVRILKSFGTDDNPTGDTLVAEMYREITSVRLLLWAGLLHDIGKHRSGGSHAETGAAMVPKILAQKGLSEEEIETVRFLVEEHLLLIKTATRRDINDEETAIQLARTIRKEERLRMLYLLTLADSMATGPKACTDWSFALLKNLFFKVLNILQNGELATSEAMEAMEKKRAVVLSSAAPERPRKAVEELFGVMSPRYLLYVDSDAVLKHVALFFSLVDKHFVWDITHEENTETRTITICAKDAPGFFARVAGTFTLNGIDILDVQVFTWRNNIALDIFKVTPPKDQLFETEKWEKIHHDLTVVLADELDLSRALAGRSLPVATPAAAPVHRRADKVVVDNRSSSFFTLIEVYTRDVHGLLYSLTSTLAGLGLDIWVAKIATNADQVVDVFYVRDFDGQKIQDADQVCRIETALLAALSGSQVMQQL